MTIATKTSKILAKMLLASVGICSLVVGVISTPKPVEAGVSRGYVPPTHRRVTYTISDLNEADIIDACNKTFGSIDDVSRIGDKIFCMNIERRGSTNHSFSISLNGKIEINGKTSGQITSNGGVQVASNDGTTIVIVKKLISTNKACDLKHPGDGTWASNGGTHCDDSYLKPKWEN